MPISNNIDLGLKYRYFRTGRLNCRRHLRVHGRRTRPCVNDVPMHADAPRRSTHSDNRFSSHSLLASLIYNFGAAAAAAAAAPAAASAASGSSGDSDLPGRIGDPGDEHLPGAAASAASAAGSGRARRTRPAKPTSLALPGDDKVPGEAAASPGILT